MVQAVQPFYLTVIISRCVTVAGVAKVREKKEEPNAGGTEEMSENSAAEPETGDTEEEPEEVISDDVNNIIEEMLNSEGSEDDSGEDK